MKEEIFQAGDLVQLKSGSRIMTVENINGNNVTVTFQDNGKQKKQAYEASSLVKFKPQGPMSVML